MLHENHDTKPLILAQGDQTFPVHMVRNPDEDARSVCGLNPEPTWSKVWRESISLRDMPNGVCRECWHSTKFAETFAAALQ